MDLASRIAASDTLVAVSDDDLVGLSGSDLLIGIAAFSAYATLGFVLLIAGYKLLDRLTPGDLGHLIWVEHNVNASRITVAHLTAVTIVITTAALTSVGGLFGALLDVAVFGALALVVQAVAFRVIDRVTPGDLGAIITDPTPSPSSYVTGAWTVAISVVLAVAVY